MHADIYREGGGEEARKEQQRAKKMQRRGAGGPRNGKPQARPTNKTGREALSDNNF